MSAPIMVVKRNGQRELADYDKIHRVISWANEGLEQDYVSQVALDSKIHFVDGMRTRDIQREVIKAASNLINDQNPEAALLAGRLVMLDIRKEAYGVYTPPDILTHVKNLVNKGWYDKELLTKYSAAEYAIMEHAIDHERDMTFQYAAAEQMEGKYLIQDRVTKEIFESPQMLYMLVAAALFAEYPEDVRMNYVVAFYEATSTYKISLPTPIMAGVRSTMRQFSSCVKVEVGDSLDSIGASDSAVMRYIAQRAGIGLNIGRLRAMGSKIRNGQAFHTGLLPFIKKFASTVKCCSQGGVRGGAATFFYPLWHRECPDLLELKNNRGTEETRERRVDYGVQINTYLYRRLLSGGNISLFSPSETPGLWENFFADQDEFARLYEKYEADTSIERVTKPARELFSLLMQERASTGRIYVQNVDHCNTHSPFIPEVAPVRQSNLCLEIALPTSPIDNIKDEDGEIALCTLSAINMGVVTLAELPEITDLTVRALDALLDYQDYPVAAAKKSTLNRRTLGVGVINYAKWLAQQGLTYSGTSGLNETFEYFEAMQYNLMRASVQLAKEQGACPLFHETRMSQGIMPFDTANDFAKSLVTTDLKQDWDTLRDDIAKYGMRNSTLSALMPSETSSQISNATNGIEPPRGLVSAKKSKDGIMRQVVPNIKELRDKYELLWNIGSNEGYLKKVGVMQIFVCQAISANTNYDPDSYEDGMIPMNTLLKDLLLAAKLGVKTLYYHNTRDVAQQSTDVEVVEKEDEDCESGACKI